MQESATGSPAPIFGHYRTLLHPDGSPFILGNSRDGITYKAIDTRLGRPVGLKIISRELLWSPEAKQRFLRNARSAASIQHPNIATIFEIGTESDVYYIVTELPEGEDLERYVAREGPPWPEVALRVVSQVAQALDGFQARGLVHGNIKPSSIIATVDRLGELRVKLIDFDAVTANGIKRRFSLSARAIDSATPESAHAPTTEMFVGSPAFASPEQCEAKKLDIRSDIYSLGITLWYLLSGKLPFAGSVAEIIVGHVIKPPPFDELVSVPIPVFGLLMRMLEKSPNNRFQTLAELQSAVERAAVRLQSESELSLSPDETRGVAPPSPAVSPCISAEPATALPILADENIQFKVYRPTKLEAGRWHRMLVFTQVDESADPSPDQPSPAEEIERIAQRILADDFNTYQQSETQSYFSVPRASEITLLPEAKGISFNPRRRSFIWAEGLRVHDEHFLLLAPENLVGSLVRGRLSVFLGHLLLADIALNFRVVSEAPSPSARESSGNWIKATPFRKVFASYSHKDMQIVESMEQQVKALGYEYLRDLVNLRSGSVWSEALQQMIDAADIFQLFWSSNSSSSKYVEQEWRYALTLRRPAFIRPTYWQVPMPPAPESLRQIQFYRLPAVVPIDREKRCMMFPGDASPPEPMATSSSLPRPGSTRPGSSPPPRAKGIGRLVAIASCLTGVFLIMVIAFPIAINLTVGNRSNQPGITPTVGSSPTPVATPTMRATTTPNSMPGSKR